MKALAVLIAAIGLSGCVAVPYGEAPGVYIGVPVPALVIQPQVRGYYGYRDGYRQRWH